MVGPDQSTSGSLSGLVFEMVGEAVCDGEFGIPFVELCLAHGDLAVTFAAFDVFLMEKLEGDTYAFQFLMYVLVVRITVHGLVRELFRIEDAIVLWFPQGRGHRRNGCPSRHAM